MKLYTLNMKKAVAKCNQVDAPELDLPPFRRLNSFVNKLVFMADRKEDHKDDMNMMTKFIMMMTIMQGFNNQEASYNYGRHKCAHGGAGGCKDHKDDMNMMMKFIMMMTIM